MRKRTPGDSSIWPKTISVRGITPASCMSCQSSWPSRIRSPTPAKTDTPRCRCTMACMNSMIRTVLPTPAPPNRPVLPPRTKGHSRSITLMPVGRISPTPIASSSGPGAATIGREAAGDERRAAVQRVAEQIEQPPEAVGRDRHHERPAAVEDRQVPAQPRGAVQRDGAGARFVEVAVHLQRVVLAVGAHVERLVQRRQTGAQDVDHRPVHLLDHAQRLRCREFVRRVQRRGWRACPSLSACRTRSRK